MEIENNSLLFNDAQYKKITSSWLDKVMDWIFIEEDHPCR